jgi:hypothetical protein
MFVASLAASAHEALATEALGSHFTGMAMELRLDAIEALNVRCGRGEACAARLAGNLVRHLDADAEATLAGQEVLSTQVRQKLLKSRRYGTAREMASRPDLSVDELEHYASHRDDTTRRMALSSTAWPIENKIARSGDVSHGVLTRWCREDAEFSKHLIAERCSEGGDELFTYLPNELSEDLVERVVVELGKNNQSGLRAGRAAREWLGGARKVPEAVRRAVVEAWAARNAPWELSTYVDRELCEHRSAVGFESWGYREYTFVWTDPATFDLALEVARSRAYASHLLDGEALDRAVGEVVDAAGGSQADLAGALALNPNLTSDQADRLVDHVDDNHAWCLARSPLTSEGRKRAVAALSAIRSAVAAAGVLADDERAERDADWVVPWLEYEILESSVAQRSDNLGAREFHEWSRLLLGRYPELTEAVLGVVRTDDYVDQSLAQELARRAAEALTEDRHADNLAGLLGRWTKDIASLVSSARKL